MLDGEVFAERYLIDLAKDRRLDVELGDGTIRQFTVPVAVRPEPMPWTDWLAPRTALRKLPSGRTPPTAAAIDAVEIRYRVTRPVNLSCSPRSRDR